MGQPAQTARQLRQQQQYHAASAPPPQSDTLERLYALEAQLQTMQHAVSELIADELHRAQAQHMAEAADAAPQHGSLLQDDEPTEQKLDEPIGQPAAEEAVADNRERQEEEEDREESQEEHIDVSGEGRDVSTPEESTSSPGSPDHVRQLRQRYFARQSSNDSTS